MQVQVIGLNHSTAPIEVREKVGFTPDLVAKAYNALGDLAKQTGIVIVSTCNRTEIYTAGPVGYADVLTWWEQVTGIERGEFADYLFWYRDDEAIKHLFKVASGLDSMVLGETQILGQVKDAYQIASEARVTGQLHRVFQFAMRVAKRAHTETGVSQNALSMGHAVIELARKVFEDMAPVTALVVGTGDMGTLVARYLQDSGVGRLVVTNRTREKAEVLAKEVGGEVVAFDSLYEAIAAADIIVTSTSSPVPIICYDGCRQALKGTHQRLRFFFDLSVPRDIEPTIDKLGEGVFLYDVDDVKHIISANFNQRQQEAVKAERLIDQELVHLKEELGANDVGSVIRAVREKAERIRQTELSKAMGQLSDLSSREKEIVGDTTRLIMNKFLNDVMVTMRHWGVDGDKVESIEAVRELFRLDEETSGTRENRKVAKELIEVKP